MEKNKDIIKEFFDITLTLEIFEGNSDKMRDRYVLYFVDKNKKVIISAEFYYKYIFRLLNRSYDIDPSQNEKLRNLLNINRD